MARPLVIAFGKSQITLDLQKIERSDLYGYVDLETVDEHGRPCSIATLADDGRTVIPPGGAASLVVDADGNTIDRSTLKPVDEAGNEIVPVASSYSAPVEAKDFATIDDFLTHDIRLVYAVDPAADLGPLAGELKSGKILTFPYSYRGGLEADAAFLLQNPDGAVFLLIGNATEAQFVGLAQSAALSEEADEAEEVDPLDFGMM